MIRITGKMTPEDAGVVRKLEAIAMIIAAVGFSFAAIIAALGLVLG